MGDQGVVGLVDAFEHSVSAGIAVATRDPQLLHERTSIGETALHLLVLGESVDAVRSILELGVDVGAVCMAGESPLSLAASRGRADLIQILLQKGAPLRPEGQHEPTLHKAVRSGSVEAVRAVLDAGADINEQADFGEAPIHVAVDEDLVDVARLLLARGANAMVKCTFGGTALEVARRAGSEACVALLSSRH
jgi:uncharacterized protein